MVDGLLRAAEHQAVTVVKVARNAPPPPEFGGTVDGMGASRVLQRDQATIGLPCGEGSRHGKQLGDHRLQAAALENTYVGSMAEFPQAELAIGAATAVTGGGVGLQPFATSAEAPRASIMRALVRMLPVHRVWRTTTGPAMGVVLLTATALTHMVVRALATKCHNTRQQAHALCGPPHLR